MDMLHERFDARLAVEFPATDIRRDFVSSRRAVPKAAAATFHTKAGVPDVAAEVAAMSVAALAAITLAFLLLFATTSPATMLIGIGIGLATIYLAVPAIFLKVEAPIRAAFPAQRSSTNVSRPGPGNFPRGRR